MPSDILSRFMRPQFRDEVSQLGLTNNSPAFGEDEILLCYDRRRPYKVDVLECLRGGTTFGVSLVKFDLVRDLELLLS